MNKKYQKYIEYIVNDIKPPYFHNMEDHYGLKDNEYPLVLSKLYEQPVTIKGNNVYDINGNIIYYEYDNGDWRKYGYDDNDNEIYYETSDGDWIKYEYDINGNNIYSENSDGDWYKYEYDANRNEIYYEDSDGVIQDNR